MRFTSFQRLAIGTTMLTYLLIAVGGLVRASGAGLGCPDWPRCFGSWIPPASAADLPASFDAAQFNAALMWTEYLNRLLGVTLGFAVLATAVSAWRRHRRESGIVAASIAALLLTAFQGWLGGRVVAHELAPWIVTVHMLVALVIVILLQWAVIESLAPTGPVRTTPDRIRLGWWAWSATLVLLVQVGAGTLVRGRVDDALGVFPRDQALSTVGGMDVAHRGFSMLVGAAVAALWAWTWTRYGTDRALVRAATLALACVVVQLAAGLVLASFALPPAAQVTHLTVASLLLGALTTLALVAWRWPAPDVAR